MGCWRSSRCDEYPRAGTRVESCLDTTTDDHRFDERRHGWPAKETLLTAVLSEGHGLVTGCLPNLLEATLASRKTQPCTIPVLTACLGYFTEPADSAASSVLSASRNLWRAPAKDAAIPVAGGSSRHRAGVVASVAKQLVLSNSTLSGTPLHGVALVFANRASVALGADARRCVE